MDVSWVLGWLKDGNGLACFVGEARFWGSVRGSG